MAPPAEGFPTREKTGHILLVLALAQVDAVRRRSRGSKSSTLARALVPNDLF
jgi:hypothetical protein